MGRVNTNFSVPGFGQIRDMVLPCTEREAEVTVEVEVAVTLISGVRQ